MNFLTIPLLALPRAAKRFVVVVLDLCLALVSVWAAFYLRIDQTGLPVLQQGWVYLLAPMLAFPIFVRLGLYRAIFRYTGMAALFSTAKAVGLYGALFFSVLLLLKLDGVPRSMGLIQPMLFLLLVGASRALARFWLAGNMAKILSHEGRLLIYGAGDAGVQTASALAITRQYLLLGFIDDDPAKIGRTINGLDIYAPDDVPDAVDRMGVTDILLAIPSMGRAQRNAVIDKLREVPVHVRTLPGMADLASGRVTIRDIQELDIEDLLGRSPVPPDAALLARNLGGKTVLVTGAGGSIGSELCRQIVLERPRQLVLVEHNEFGLYSIHHELERMLGDHQLQTEVIPLLASVANLRRMREICTEFRPATVYHAAAYKHVPLVEGNAAEGIMNNVFGTLNMARAAMESQAENFVLVSTDKAVRPTNVMGASKRMAELALQAMAASPAVDYCALDPEPCGEVRNRTVFAMVRFGNVLGSSGSVVPLFRRQLAEGSPLTVTHEEVTRYFMTIPEAAQLVLQAGAMAHGGEVFVLDMGQSVKIMDLARRMIQLSGLTLRDKQHPGGDVEIQITGLRPGEKLYEELLIGDNPEPTAHQRIMKAREEFVPWADFSPVLARLRLAAEQSDRHTITTILAQHVHGYGVPAAAVTQSPSPIAAAS
ncbi:polysaccharide biosynthesis protein [Cupriavidus pauculus]|uniref:Polysaccharide biosynthesis protein n=1 Tax=Cupriavidus pauculus TaxID=82633 RepID=A0A2N5CH65_9BURK|nr:nucleoside-diphosphate sugar epimerase/dehydratase [Cupriavidus pauculus]PLQ01553.1 polysaccharide biosynthesis protein [Cupriavidus pauculus]